MRKLFARYGQRLRLRITLESFIAAEHDAIRGRGTFEQTVNTVCELAAMGFVPVINAERPFLSVTSDDAIRNGFLEIFGSRGVEVEVNLIENIMEMGHQADRLRKAGRALSRKSSSPRTASGFSANRRRV